MVLTAGRKTPREGENVVRGEGVALVLSGLAVDAWKRGGSQWSAWSSRAVSACLQVGKGAAGRLHVVSCYAPTRAASRETKDTFLQEIENILSAVPQGEKYVLMGDFNACVGSRECAGDLWDGEDRTGIRWSMMLGRSFSPSSQPTRLQYAIHDT